MPSPARPPRAPSSGRKSAAPPAVIRADESDSRLDPADIVLGIVWAVAIPLVVAGLLYAVGMSPGGGGTGLSAKEQMERRDQLAAVTAPVTYREIDLRLAIVDEMIQDRIPLYLERAKGTDDNRVKNWWQELAFRTLGICKSEIQKVFAVIPQSAEVSKRPEVEQGLRMRLAHIEAQENEIIRDNPFPQRLRDAQAEAMSAASSP